MTAEDVCVRPITSDGYVKCLCLWDQQYFDERLIGDTNCPAHGDDRDESGVEGDASGSDPCLCAERPAWGVIECPTHGTVNAG